VGEIELREASSDDIDDLTTVSRAVERADPVRRADVDLIAVDELGAILFRNPAHMPSRTWIARDRATREPVGHAIVQMPMASNRTHVRVGVEVVPERRVQGVGSALLVEALASMDASRTTIAVHARPGPAMAWCELLGIESKQLVRESQMDLTACDLGLVRSWLSPVAAVEAGYRLVAWRGAPSEDQLPAVCVALDSMADAPLDDMEYEHAAVTPELVRDDIAAAAVRMDFFAALVLAPDGSPAGFTVLGVNRFRPVLGDQGDTVVVAGHRGHRLGRWLKAANLLAAIDVHPELRYVNTFNAESNPWMLSINEDMSFRPYRAIHVGQGPIRVTLDHLSARSAA
jgi:GNAT superfamily N-acetyltransferase